VKLTVAVVLPSKMSLFPEGTEEGFTDVGGWGGVDGLLMEVCVVSLKTRER
jgi:hypothetical protein